MMRKIGVGLTVGIITAAIPAVAFAEDVFKPSHASVPATMLATALTVIMAVLFIIVAVLLGIRAGGVDDGPGRIWPVFLLTAGLVLRLRVSAALAFEV